MKFLQKVVMTIVVLTVGIAIPCARSETVKNFGYFFMADKDGNIDSMSVQEFPKESRYGIGHAIENVDLSGMRAPVLQVWHTPSGGALTQAPLEYMYIKTAKSDKWQKLTVNKKLGYAVIPIEATSLGFAYNDRRSKLNFITVSEVPQHEEDLYFDDLSLTLKKGSIGEDGSIAADSDRTVELTLSHPDLYSLSTACGDFCWIMPDEEADITVTASTPTGEIKIFEETGTKGYNHSYTCRYTWALPCGLSEISFKFVFKDDKNNFIKFSTINDKQESDMCVSIMEKGNGGNLMPDIVFSSLPSDHDYAWYDIDGDGKKEWGTQTRFKRSVMGFNYDLMGQSKIDDLSVDQWKNYGKNEISAINADGVFDWDGSSFQEAIHFDTEVKVVDFNNDGRNDFYDRENDQLISYSPVGEFSRIPARFLTPQEYYDYVVEQKGGGLGSGLSVIGGGEGSPGAFGSFQYVDINNDGYIDFIDGSSGEYLMNVGDGRFVKDSFSGRVIFRDFNGDGINDMLSYDSSSNTLYLLLQNKDGEPKKSKLIGGFKCSDRIWCRDFDGDGDIDIVVPFDAVDNNWQSYIVTFENKGDGTFKRKEYYIDGNVDFKNCSDVDNDSNYEILGYARADASEYSEDRQLVLYRMKGLVVATNAETLRNGKRISSEESGILVADIDNSGRMRIIMNDSIMTVTDVLNLRPQRLAAPKLVFDAESGDLIVSWDMGSDKETAPVDLTYELRVGTGPDKCDILWSDALFDGMRRNLLQGNCGYSRQRRLAVSSWPMGKIYISVQALDANGMGSEFSEYAVFEKSDPASDFLVETPSLCAVSDECILKLNSIPENGVTYEWDFDGAVVREASDMKNVVVWQTSGIKKVTLKAIYSDGTNAVVSKDVEVVPARLTEGGELIGDAVDLDLDGKYELLSGGHFLEYDDNGEYTPLKRLFNNNMTIGYQHKIVDINRDGLPDLVYSSHNGYGRYYVGQIINAEDAYMEVIDEVEVPEYYSFDCDLDNDGLVDAEIYRNTGDYINFVAVNDGVKVSDCQYYDIDGDGLMDKIYDAGNGIIKIFKNKGNFIFEEEASLNLGKRENGFTLGDMDGDGMVDIAWNDAWSKYVTSYSDFTYVRWGDGTVSEIPAPSGHQFYFIYSVFDFDNNGCMDLLIPLEYDSKRNRIEYVMVFFKADRTWEIVNLGQESDFVDGNIAYRRGDGALGYGSMRIIGPENTLPEAPTAVRSTQNDEAIVIEWNAPNDHETPSAALRYNVSIKRKDKEGEGAYFWSPMNGGLNGVPVPSSTQLLNSTRLTLPNGVIAPGEYEVKVQAVDTQMEAGDFSEVFIMKVSEGNILSMPAETMVGQATELKMTYGYKSSDFDFGKDAEIVNELGSTVWVKWASEGVKTVTCGDFSKSILVHPALNAYFTLPSEVLVGAKIILECDNLHNSEWSGLQLRDFESYMPLDQHFISFTEIDESHAEMVFRYSVTPRGIQIRHTLTESYGSDEFSTVVTTKVLNKKPSVSRIDRDLASGACMLYWSMPSELSGLANGVKIYRESDEIGKFALLAELPLGAESFSDQSVGNNDEVRRYCLSFGLPYGETALAPAHRPLELMVNGYNSEYPILTWSAYEGKNVKSYRLLRGSSVENLTAIKELSSGVMSLTDFDPLEGQNVYAVEAVLLSEGNDDTVRSNAFSFSYSGVEGVVDDQESLRTNVSELGIAVSGIKVSDNHKARLQLFNSSGMLVASLETSTSEAVIPCGELPSGVYYVVVNGAKHQLAKLFVH